jgi:hypothetical protein
MGVTIEAISSSGEGRIAMSSTKRRLVPTAIVAAIVMVTAAGCVGPPLPQQLGSVPGQFTFHQIVTAIDSNGIHYGSLEGSAWMCWSSTTALKISWVAGTGTGTNVRGGFHVDGGADYPPGIFWYWGQNEGGPLVTDVLAPGCGSLTVLDEQLVDPDPTGQSTVTLEVTAG